MIDNKRIRSLSLDINIPLEKLERFTTLLQSGIKLPAVSGMSLGVFIDDLPGFDIDYISHTIQTIFLDGNAIDDLEHPLTQQNHVLALSAAMPGLAGAIFRRNSLCAALRTQGENPTARKKNGRELYIHLKLFNSIALEKGGELLRLGGIFSGETLISFLQQRPSLVKSIKSFNLDTELLDPNNLLSTLSAEQQYFFKINTIEQQESK